MSQTKRNAETKALLLKQLDAIAGDFEDLWKDKKRMARSFKGASFAGTRQSYRREAANFAYALNAILGFRKHMANVFGAPPAGPTP